MMKCIDYLKIIFHQINRNKHNVYYIISFTFFILFILLILNFKSNYTNYITTTITENIGARTIVISSPSSKENLEYEQIENIDHIEYVYSSKYDTASVESSFANDNFDGEIELRLGNEYTLPQNIMGNTLDSKDTGVAICPVEFYPSSDASELIVDNSLTVDGNEMLNEKFKVYYTSYKFEEDNIVPDEYYEKTFKIIGLYNSSEVGNTNNVCYISNTDLTDIKDIVLSINEGVIYGYFAIVDESQNVSQVISDLNELGYEAEQRLLLDTEVFNNISLICNILIAIMIISIILVLVFYIKKKSIQDTKNIGVLRSIGYNKKTVYILYTLEIFIINILTLLFSIILFYILYILILQFLIKPYLNIIFEIKLYNYNILLVVGLTLILSLILGVIYTAGILKRNIASTIRRD